MLRMLLIGLFYAGGTAMATRATVYAACLFLWTDIFQPLSFAKQEGAYPVAWYVLFVLLGSAALNFAMGRLQPRFGIFFFVLSGFIAWVFMATVMSPFPLFAWPEFIKYLKYLLPLIVIYSTLQSLREIEMVAAVLAASVGVWAAQTGLHCLVNGTNIFMAIPGGQMTERNDFTAAIVGTLPLMVYFATNYRLRFRKPVRAGIWLAALLSVAAIVFSLSRGASLGLAVMVAAYVTLISRSKFRDFALTAALGVLVLAFLPEEWYARMDTIEIGAQQSEDSAAERMHLMLGAWRATLDRAVFGWGPDGWLQVVHIYGNGTHNPHSIYLKLSSETGLTGLVIYLGIMIFTYFRCLAVRRLAVRAGDRRSASLITAMLTGIIGLLSAMTFLNYPFSEYLWAWICLAHAFAEIYPHELARAARRAHRARARSGPEGANPAGGPPGQAGPGREAGDQRV